MGCMQEQSSVSLLVCALESRDMGCCYGHSIRAAHSCAVTAVSYKETTAMHPRCIVRLLPFFGKEGCELHFVRVNSQILLPLLRAFLLAMRYVDLKDTLLCSAAALTTLNAE